MRPLARFGFFALVVAVLAGCGANKNAGGEAVAGTVLRKTIGIDLAKVGAFVATSGTSTPSQALRAGRYAAGSSDGGPTEPPPPPKLFALTLSGEVLEVSLVEAGTAGASPDQRAPPVAAIYSTPSWVLFSTPGFRLDVNCGLIAARRVDGALFCSPLSLHSDVAGRDPLVRTNAAGDVVYTVAGLMNAEGMVPQDSVRLYKITLAGPEGPAAATMLDSSVFMLQQFEANAAGDLYVGYYPSALDPTLRSQVLPVGGGAPFTLQGYQNAGVVAGERGKADEDSFYVAGGGAGSFDGTIRVVARSGASFVETPHVLNMACPQPCAGFNGLYRLGDGVYMFNHTDRSLVRVIADGGFVPNPAPIMLAGVDRIVGPGNDIVPVAGRWVFIAATGADYKFVRFDGSSQQDIPLQVGIDVSSFTVSTSGAIDFLGNRVSTGEKVRGSVAAGATVMTIDAAGVLDPAQVVAFTRIN
jgi:hypothetical protein